MMNTDVIVKNSATGKGTQKKYEIQT